MGHEVNDYRETTLDSQHEAAHAVALIVCGAQDVSVCLNPPCTAYLQGSLTTRDRLLVALAGRAMEQRIGVSVGEASEKAHSDHVRALQMIMELGETLTLSNHLARARDFVEEHLATISRVAAALRERGLLSDYELRQLVK